MNKRDFGAVFPLLVVAVTIALVGYGCQECTDICGAHGETWHWSENAALPPAADACTCADSGGVLRRRTR